MSKQKTKGVKGGADNTALKVRGFSAASVVAGIKKNGRADLALILSDKPATVAGVYTTNKVKAAPVVYDQKRTGKGTARGVIINSGNANACTGTPGYDAATRMARAAERATGAPRGSILVSSTGVIGVPLPVEKIEAAAPALACALSPDGLSSAATAIMTTDAFPKTAIKRVRIGARTVTVAGIAKGAGMICPDMATMLCYILSDATIGPAALRRALKVAADASFNRIVVDNDMSTNDTVLAFANGSSGCAVINSGSPEFDKFAGALTDVATTLSKMIVTDGEGATRIVEINVTGAASRSDAVKGARTVATSMLVKTAFFGGDPNWGRIIAALGRAGIKLDPNKVDITFNGVRVVRSGLDTGAEKKAAQAIKTEEVIVDISIGKGRGSAKVWTSDLTYEYVKINSEYRT